jgi:hypothetical protein
MANDPPHRSCAKCRRWGSCEFGGQWWCVEHAPPGFWPEKPLTANKIREPEPSEVRPAAEDFDVV